MNFIIKDADEGKVLRNSHSFNHKETSSIIYFPNMFFLLIFVISPNYCLHNQSFNKFEISLTAGNFGQVIQVTAENHLKR